MNWRKFFAEKPLPKPVPGLTAWDEAEPVPEGDELMAFRKKILPMPRVPVKPRVEILKKGEKPDRAMGRLGAADHGLAAAGMKAAVAVRKVEREVADLQEETVGRLLGLERLKVRELEGRLIEMESRARLAEARVEELVKQLMQGAQDYDFADRCAKDLEARNQTLERNIGALSGLMLERAARLLARRRDPVLRYVVRPEC